MNVPESISLLMTSATTLLAAFLTFRHVRISTTFRDFTVFVVSLICAIAVALAPALGEVPLLPWIIILYVNGMWLYGAEPRASSKKAFVVSPAVTRVFLGLLLLMTASWLSMSGYNAGIALIIILIYVLLGAYKGKKVNEDLTRE